MTEEIKIKIILLLLWRYLFSSLQLINMFKQRWGVWFMGLQLQRNGEGGFQIIMNINMQTTLPTWKINWWNKVVFRKYLTGANISFNQKTPERGQSLDPSKLYSHVKCFPRRLPPPPCCTSTGSNYNLFVSVFTRLPVNQLSHPQRKLVQCENSHSLIPVGSNWLGFKKPLYQWSWSESCSLQAARTFHRAEKPIQLHPAAAASACTRLTCHRS